MLSINYIILFRITCIIIKKIKEKKNLSDKEKSMKIFCSFVTFFTSMGLTWIFKVVQISKARFVFEILFCFCSGLQGFIFFILYLYTEKDVRMKWMEIVLRRKLNNKQNPTMEMHTINDGL